jgi:hypothetical protein
VVDGRRASCQCRRCRCAAYAQNTPSFRSVCLLHHAATAAEHQARLHAPRCVTPRFIYLSLV